MTGSENRVDPARAAALEHALAPLVGRELLVGLDVDGTLVHHDGSMSERVHEALRAAAECHRVVIATGRSVGATLPIVEAAGVASGYAVCSNGGVTVELDPAEEQGYRVISTRTFHPGQALATLHEVAPRAGYAVETADGSFFSTAGFQDRSFGVVAHPAELADLADMEAVRVVVHDPELDPREFARVVADAGVHGVEYAIGFSAWLDMAAPGVSKATGLEAVREHLGLAAGDSVAIGDGYNDTEMLRWAGVGVAMGQAPDGVVESADVVTADVGADGAALVLERIV